MKLKYSKSASCGQYAKRVSSQGIHGMYFHEYQKTALLLHLHSNLIAMEIYIVMETKLIGHNKMSCDVIFHV